MDNWGTIITGILALIGVALGTWATYKRGKQSDKVTATVSREANAITWSGQLLERLENVENEVKNLRADLNKVTRISTTAINFIERVLLWAIDGCNGPMPLIPKSLIEHLDADLVDEHVRQQANPKA
ncbi:MULTISPECIES: hypothetical protein [unclassified Arthrobacter]|uniref:hypothetical protein n=1 Tax=unclassified Arthrobacter TaxID=235627 RepID=UPI001492B14F|nr:MULTISPECIES: hypothetical protein [unclassified Arthrobacter]MBE0009610.1 hypothetical protein [Arthrobacter sp. AET 35A]NOJ63361.1 hypothetical protein [Arthrobacter sp. 147(2020)]